MYQEAFVCTLVLEYVCIIRDLCMWTYVLTGMCVKTRTSLFISTETCLALFFVDAHRAGRAIFKCLCVYIHFVHAFVCMRVRVCVTACMQVCMCVCACVIVCIYIHTCIFFFVWNLVRQIHPVVGETFPTAKCIRYSNKIHTAFK